MSGNSGVGRRPLREPEVPTGINVAVGAAVVVVSAFVSAAVPASAGPARFGVLAAALAGFAALTVDPRAVAAVGVLAFLVFNGFLVNQLGELSWHGSADTLRLSALAAAGVGGLAGGSAYRAVRRLRAWRQESKRAAAEASRRRGRARSKCPCGRHRCGTGRRHVMPDVVFVLLTVALFAVLALAVRAVERL